MNKPIRTTLVYGLLSALMMIPVIWYQHTYRPWPKAMELALWADLAVYAVLLCRWSRTRFSTVFFPLLLLFGVAVWPRVHFGFILMALGVFSWIRSGICFRGTPLRALLAELTTILGSLLLVAFWWPQSAVSWALALWLFFLVQTVYFFIVPSTNRNQTKGKHTDPFEEARREAERVLEAG